MNEKLKHDIVKGTTWLSISKILTQLYTFVINIYIANILVPDDYALMGIGLLVIILLQVMHEFGYGTALVQRLKDFSREEINSIFWFIGFIGAILSVICYISSQFIETYFNKPGLKPIIMVLSWVIFLNTVTIVPYKLIERKMKFKLKATIDLVSKVLSLSFAGILAYLGYGVWALVYAQIFHAVVVGVISFHFEPFRPMFKLNFKVIIDMMTFSLNIIALRLVWYFRRNIDQIIGGKFLGSLDFGYYSFSFRLVAPFIDTIKNVMSTISLPMLAKLQKEDDQFDQAYLNIIKYCALVAFPIFVGGSILSDELIYVILPEKWAPVMKIFNIICLIQIFRIMIAPNEEMFVALGKPSYSLFFNLLITIVLLFAFLFGVKRGIDGLLLVWLITMPIIYIVWTYIILKYRNITVGLYFEKIKPALFGSMMMLFVLYVLKRLMLSPLDIDRFIAAYYLAGLIFIGGTTYLLIVHLIDKTIIPSIKVFGKQK